MTGVPRVPPAPALVCRPATGPADVAEHHRIRRAVFVDEQRLFVGSDLDAHDARTDVVHLLARAGDRAVGAVRLFPLDPHDGGGIWQGDRLAVLPADRAAGAGRPLVRRAVAEAAARGGRSMVAHVQEANRRFFERLGWAVTGHEIYVGRPHVAMAIDLTATLGPPSADDPG